MGGAECMQAPGCQEDALATTQEAYESRANAVQMHKIRSMALLTQATDGAESERDLW